MNTNIAVSLRFMGENYDIHEISKLLEICPTKAWKKGEPIRNTGHKYSYTAWIYDVDAMECLFTEIQARKIQNIFSDKVEQIILLKKKYNLSISIDFCIKIVNSETPGIYFDESFIKFAAEIGARFDIDTYVY